MGFSEVVRDWPQVRLQVADDARSILARVPKEEDGAQLQGLAITTAMDFFGWLPRLGTEGEMDRWYLNFNPLADEILMAGSEMLIPTGWDGSAVALLWDEEGEIQGMLGELGPTIRECWGVTGRPVPAPKWPRLHQGETGSRIRSELRLIGVVRRYTGQKDAALGGLKIMAGWADQEGKLLGWEGFDDTALVREVGMDSIRHFGAMEGWDLWEASLRTASFGKVL
jgi:hypothetical protein